MLAGGGSLSEGAGNGGKKAAAERFFDQGGADFSAGAFAAGKSRRESFH